MIGVREGMLSRAGTAFLQEAAELGFECVELDLGKEGRATGWGGPAGRQELRQAAAALRLPITSLCLGCLNGIPLAGEDPLLREESLTISRQGIAWARELGAGVVLLPFFGKAELKTTADRERLLGALQVLAPLATSSGVVLGIESTLRADELVALLERVDSEGVGSYWDTGNAVWKGYDPVTEVRILGRWITRVHLKDTFKDPSDRHLGEGRVDFPAVAAELARAGYSGPLVLETPTRPNPVEQARRNLAFARGIFGTAASATTAGSP